MVRKNMEYQISRMFSQLPLRLILILPFVLQISSAVGLTSWLSLKNGQKAVSDVAHQLRSELTARIVQHVTTYMAMPQHIIEDTAEHAQLGLLDLEDSTSLERYLWHQMRTHNGMFITAFGSETGKVSAVGIENNNNLVIRARDQGKGKLYTYSIQGRGTRGNVIKSENFDLKSRPWYQTAVTAKKPTWTDIYLNNTLPILIISAVRPIYNSQTGVLAGVTNATLSLQQISYFLQNLEIGRSGETFIIERSGNLVASSTGEILYSTNYIGNQEKRERRQAINSSNLLVRDSARYLIEHFGSLSAIKKVEQLEFVSHRQRHFLQVTPLEDELGLDWLIVIVVPESDFMEQIHSNTRLTIYLCIGALALAIYSCILTARWVIQPLSRLNQAAKEIAQGNLHQAVSVGYINEIRELASSFNQMVTQLQTSFTQLHTLNKALSVSESRLSQFLEALPVGITIHNASGQLIYINQIGKSFFRNEKVLNITWLNLAKTYHLYRAHTQELYPIEELPFVRALAGETVQTDDLEILKANQRVPIEVWATPVFDDKGCVVFAIAAFQDIQNRKQAEEQLIYNALHDTLTDLPNRNLLMQRLELTINRAREDRNYQFAVLFLDLDRFKVINDSLGHLAGDELLIQIAQKLGSIIQPTNLAARLGGDEFIILLEKIQGVEDAIQTAEHILAELQYPLILKGREVFITTSIGIVLGTKDYVHAGDILRDADIAMYQAKARGKDQYKIFDRQMHTQALKRLYLENDLRKALERQEFVVYYQPIVALDTEALAGFEALVRWQHPTRGFISPAEFITVAEETGLIIPLDRWVFQKVCSQLAEWQAKFPDIPFLKVSVNLSVQDLREPHLIEYISNTLSQTGLDGKHLTLEITESVLIEKVGAIIKLLSQLKERGIQISIDDFGTGYSSLSYLHRLPVDTLKIDRSFVSHMQTTSRNHKIAETILALSNQLEIKAIAEGVETQQQLQWLRQLGCEFGQGCWFSQPLAPEAVEKLLARHHTINSNANSNGRVR
jgi:diguanylate cyclase (GGDEF)-like protein/PAS domain S-box-containing protein